jgi:hypothetical protein
MLTLLHIKENFTVEEINIMRKMVKNLLSELKGEKYE